MTEIELEMENDTELRIECEQIYIMDDYEQLKNKPRLNGKEISGDNVMRQIQPYQNGLKHKINHHTPRRR